MDELIQENPELEPQAEESPVEEIAEEVTEEEESLAEIESDYDEWEEEETDEIFFTSDFVLTADDFLETIEYAYLRVANNSWILIGLIVVFAISSMFSGSTDYLRFLPVVALLLAVTQVRRYANTDKDIQKSYALMQQKTTTGDMHYHIEFGEYMHVTNNGRQTPKHDLNEIKAICESEHYLLLCLDHQLYIPVAKGSVQADNPDEFIPYLQHCCRDLKKKKISKVTGKKKIAGYGVIGCVIVTVITLIIGFVVGYM